MQTTAHVSRPFTRLAMALLCSAAFVAGAQAADTWDPSTAASPASGDKDMAAARAAIHDKHWAEAVPALKRVVQRDPRNADAYNLLGYSYRWMNQMDESFAAYEKALQIDPRHRGAHEYMGVAYLKVGNMAKAQEHLARLREICGNDCAETRELSARIDEARQAHR